MTRSALIRRGRVLKYRLLSDRGCVTGGSPIVYQPVLFLGPGRITLGERVEFGWPRSVGFHTEYVHVEASRPGSVVEIADGAKINNGCMIKSEGPGIRIAADALIGSRVTIYDSDFHALDPAERRANVAPRMGEVRIGEGAFIGDGALILKGVTIGAGAVIGAGSVVTRSVEPGAVVAGNPAQVVRSSVRA